MTRGQVVYAAHAMTTFGTTGAHRNLARLAKPFEMIDPKFNDGW